MFTAPTKNNGKSRDGRNGGKQKKFTGECYHCGKKGHKASQCWLKDKSQGRSGAGGADGGKNGGKNGGKSGPPKCTHCGKIGHTEKFCWEKEANAHQRPDNWVKRPGGGTTEVAQAAVSGGTKEFQAALIDIEPPSTEVSCYGQDRTFELLKNPHVFVFDSGTSQHCTGNSTGTFDKQSVNVTTVGHNGSTCQHKFKGTLRVRKLDKHRNHEWSFQLTDVHYSPDSAFNLFSATKLMDKGWSLRGDQTQGFVMYKGDQTVKFDIRITTRQGCIWAGYFQRRDDSGDEISVIKAPAADSTATKVVKLVKSTTTPVDSSTDGGAGKKPVKMTVQKAHQMLGHSNEAATGKTAKMLGWLLSRGELKICESCAKGKGKQKNASKSSEAKKATKPFQRVFLDIKSIKPPKDKADTPFVIKKNLRVIVDKYSGCGFAEWFQKKSGMVEPTTKLFYQWQQKGFEIAHVRCDNAGENVKLEARVKDAEWKMTMEFEFTPRNTPQFNHLAELKIRKTVLENS